MKIITYNVNGLRAAVGKGLPEWLAQEQPDVLCLQETKLQPEQYPAEAFEALGYKAWLFSAQKKGYSGVAILSRREPDHVEYGMGIEKYDNEGRFMPAILTRSASSTRTNRNILGGVIVSALVPKTRAGVLTIAWSANR